MTTSTDPGRPETPARAVLHITVTAPDADHAARWAETLRDLVHAEHGDHMRLHTTIEPPDAGCSVAGAETEPNTSGLNCDHDSQVIEHEGEHYWACLKCGQNLGRIGTAPVEGAAKPGENPAACPGVETVPNRCGCPCEGCKHHCARPPARPVWGLP